MRKLYTDPRGFNMLKLIAFFVLVALSMTAWPERLSIDEVDAMATGSYQPFVTEQQMQTIKQTVTHLTQGRGEILHIGEHQLIVEVDCGHGVVAQKNWNWEIYREDDPNSPISISPNINQYPYRIRSDRVDARVYEHLQNLIANSNPLWCDYQRIE